MKKIILIFGLVAGAIVSGMMFMTMPMYETGTLNFDTGELLGYTTMVIALSMVFFGIKSYRDNHSNGVITFGKGFQIGILITLVASVMYVISWEIIYNTSAQNFASQYSEHQMEKLEQEGATPEVMEAKRAETNEFIELYENPVVRMGITLIEIFPVGLIVTLLSAALLRKKELLPA